VHRKSCLTKEGGGRVLLGGESSQGGELEQCRLNTKEERNGVMRWGGVGIGPKAAAPHQPVKCGAKG